MNLTKYRVGVKLELTFCVRNKYRKPDIKKAPFVGLGAVSRNTFNVYDHSHYVKSREGFLSGH